MRKLRWWLLLLAPVRALSYSGGPPSDHVRIPWPVTALRSCTACHAGTVNSSPGSVTLGSLPASYRGGVRYTLSVILTDPDAMRARWGFELAALDGGLAQAGSLAASDVNTDVVFDSFRNLDFVRQTSAGSALTSWSFDWTAPAAGSGVTTWYFCGNAANGDGDTDFDHIFCATSSVAEEVCDPKPLAIARLEVTRAGNDLLWSWLMDPSAASGYRLYAVTSKTEIPRANQDATPTALRACAAPTSSDTACIESGVALDGESLFYQLVGVCANGDEGPN